MSIINLTQRMQPTVTIGQIEKVSNQATKELSPAFGVNHKAKRTYHNLTKKRSLAKEKDKDETSKKIESKRLTSSTILSPLERADRYFDDNRYEKAVKHYHLFLNDNSKSLSTDSK